MFTWTKPRSNAPTSQQFGLFGYLFARIELLLLILMGFLAYNMHDLFVGYIAKNATFIGDKNGQFYFATRLIGSLLLVEIILALATAYFRSRNEWDKSIFTAVVALLIAVANHYTILELFKDFADAITPEARTAIEWKMILSNFLVFILGESIGFVMHSKGKDNSSEAQTSALLEKIEAFLAQNHKTSYNGLVDTAGNPLKETAVFAQHQEPNPIGFAKWYEEKEEKEKNKGGRPPLSPQKIAQVKQCLTEGYSQRNTAKRCNVSLQKVSEIAKTLK